MLLPPILAVLTDAEARCFLTMIMNFAEPGWTGQTMRGEFDQRSGIAFPWFVVVEDGEGKSSGFASKIVPHPSRCSSMPVSKT